MRRLAVAFFVLTLAVPMQTPASAGGWWSTINLDAPYLGIGEQLSVREEIMFRTMYAAEQARTTEFHAYLVRGVDYEALDRAMSVPQPHGWWSPPEEMTLVGDVEVSRTDNNLAIATARLSIPEMPTGRYDLMFCDTGCRNPLADVIPLTGVTVSSDAVAARTARELASSNYRMRREIAGARRDARRVGRGANQAVRGATADAAQALQATKELRERVTRLGQARREAPNLLPNVLWFIAGAATVWMTTHLRRKGSRRITNDPVVVPDDARELVST
jgi:hypothetical protein